MGIFTLFVRDEKKKIEMKKIVDPQIAQSYRLQSNEDTEKRINNGTR